ncbi:MAG: DNA repair protein RecN [Lentisphaeria bacterium]|nr:DNA repair protein RecN [Lentisphaeria bacterium]
MLLWMKLKNLALVSEAEIDFAPGFNVISGETGAGKSVIMGGVALLLGARADKSAIRTGTDKCEISAEFRIPAYAGERIRAILNDADVEMEDDSILIRRVVTQTSTRNYINSVPVALPVLRELGGLLIDIHAANENQSLTRPGEQLRILDRFAGLAPEKQTALSAWEVLADTIQAREDFLQTMPSGQEAEELRKDLALIERIAPESGEDQTLAERHAVAANACSIIGIASAVSGALTDSEDSVFDRIADVRRVLNDLEKYDPAHAGDYLNRMEEIADAVSALSTDLVDHASGVEVDQAEFQAMEERMRALQSLKRKFGPGLDDVIAYADSIRQKLDDFDNAAEMRRRHDKAVAEKEAEHLAACAVLTEKRRAAAGELEKLLTAETEKLGFAQAQFQLEMSPAEPGANGADKLQIRFSANPGVPLKPLQDVASSGEICRVMLAVKTVLAEADEIPVLIFDEIDANIGGETAMRVGGEIAALGRKKQVICISHLPQVVRLAERHFLVEKSTDGHETRSRIAALDEAQRIQELARMLGGGDAALKHAQALRAE